MAYTLFIIVIIAAFILASCLLWRYGDCYRNHIIVTVSVLTAWYFSFVIVFILPLDVSMTVYRQCRQVHNETDMISDMTPQHDTTAYGDSINVTTSPGPVGPECLRPWNFVPDYIFPNLWRVVYWSSQCLTWLIMPMMQSYSKAGDFTVKGKLKSALIDNAIYYGSYLLICGILLIYIALKPGVHLDGPKIKAIASSASNTWGLFLLILLLGYALVEVPRNLWNNSKKNYKLTFKYFKAAKLSTDKCEAEETVDDILDSLQAVINAVGPGHVLHKNVETILQKVPIELKDRMSRRVHTTSDVQVPTLKSLVRLHKQVIKALHVLQRTETQWAILVEEIFHLEDVSANGKSGDKRFKPTFHKPRSRMNRILYNPTFEWYWECLLRSYFLRMMAVCTGVLSVAVVWSEVTFFSKKPVLSIFANIVNIAKMQYDYMTIVVMSTIVITYLCYCAYSTVLKIRLLNLYYLAPHHQTNEHSLIFSGMMACRLTAPMCLNFLGLIHMDSHIIKERILETYYTQIMGHMDVLGIIADGFNIYFPMAVVLFCLTTYFSLGSRILSMCGFQQFVGDDELTLDLVDEGREIITREKRKRQRLEESLARRRDLHERYPNRQIEPQDGARTGLLHDVDAIDYYVTPSQSRKADINRPRDFMDQSAGYQQRHENILTLEDEIDERFGESTRQSVPSSYDDQRAKKSVMSAPPRGLFDDV